MAAVVIEIAEAVRAALAAVDWRQPAAVSRAYAPAYEPRDLKTLRLTVVPAGLSAAALDRSGRHLFDYEVDVALQRRTDRSAAELDALMDLAQRAADLFRGKPLPGYEQARCTAVANAPAFDPDHLDELGVFTSVVTLTLRLGR